MVGEKLTFKTASIITLCFVGWEKNGEYSPFSQLLSFRKYQVTGAGLNTASWLWSPH